MVVATQQGVGRHRDRETEGETQKYEQIETARGCGGTQRQGVREAERQTETDRHRGTVPERQTNGEAECQKQLDITG